LSKGKKNYHVFHNACLAYLRKYYDDERERAGKSKVQNNIIHTDNCPTQYKCRQNFFKVATFGEVNGSRLIHKFAQKYGFKGPWDATGKLIKGAILRNEMKYDRCADARDCYLKLKRDLTKEGTEKKCKDWSNWEKDGNERILKNTTFTTQRTFIGLGIEDHDEYFQLKEAGNDHIIYTNRVSVPDMNAIEGTRTVFQIQGNIEPTSPDKWTIHTSIIPCSCSPCRSDPSNVDLCIYKEIRTINTKIVSKQENRTTDEDPYGINSLTVALLKEELRARNLKLSGNKPELLARLLAHLKEDKNDAMDDTVENHDDEGTIGLDEATI